MDVVSGGSGFIGTHLCRMLGAQGETVNIDIRPPSEPTPASHLNIDVRDFEKICSTCKGAKRIFHLAAQTSVQKSISEPLEDFSTNALGTLNMLECCRRNDINSMVFASSAAIYGNPKYTPLDESHPTLPLSPYGQSKLAADQLCGLYAQAYGLNVVRLRLFNVYGPSKTQFSPYAGVIRQFSAKLAANQPPEIYGDGAATRDFVHVDDVVGAMLNSSLSKNAYGKAYNIGSGTSISITELANLMIRASKRQLKPEFLPSRSGDIVHSTANIAAARADWGYGPKRKIEEAIVELI